VGFRASPSFVVADEIFLAAIRISEVADSHHGAGDLIKQSSGGFGPSEFSAISDVARADQDG
jgi:hypothetical protein